MRNIWQKQVTKEKVMVLDFHPSPPGYLGILIPLPFSSGCLLGPSSTYPSLLSVLCSQEPFGKSLPRSKLQQQPGPLKPCWVMSSVTWTSVICILGTPGDTFTSKIRKYSTTQWDVSAPSRPGHRCLFHSRSHDAFSRALKGQWLLQIGNSHRRERVCWGWGGVLVSVKMEIPKDMCSLESPDMT